MSSVSSDFRLVVAWLLGILLAITTGVALIAAPAVAGSVTYRVVPKGPHWYQTSGSQSDVSLSLPAVAGINAYGYDIASNLFDRASDVGRARRASLGSSAGFVAPSGAVDEVGQLALPRGGANLTQERLDHIVLRHWPTSGATNAGKFGSGTSLNDLTTMIDDTVRNGAFRPNTNGRPGTIFEMDLGSTIGTNIQGNATSRLRVVVSPSGDVITAFPY